MSANPPPPINQNERSRKSIVLTITLQCIPLLGAAGCAAEGATDQGSGSLSLVLWISILFWGLGYVYLRRWVRFIGVCLVGPLFALSSCAASLRGVTYDYEHPYRYDSNSVDRKQAVATANRASFQEALIISGAVLLLSVDAWRLAALNNAQVKAKGSVPSPLPPSAFPSSEEANRSDSPADDPV